MELLESMMVVNMRVLDEIHRRTTDPGPLATIADIVRRCTYSVDSMTTTISDLEASLVGMEYTTSDRADMCWTSYNVSSLSVHTE